jgi:hypothetical protein
MAAKVAEITALPVRTVDGWKLGDIVRLPQGRGHIFEFSALGGFCDVKLVLTGKIVRSVRVSSLVSGALS